MRSIHAKKGEILKNLHIGDILTRATSEEKVLDLKTKAMAIVNEIMHK